MANTLAPNGFHPTRNLGGGPNYQTTQSRIAYNYGSQIAYGDPVVLTTDGTITKYAVGGTSISGIFLGCSYYDPSQQKVVFQPSWSAPSNLASTQVVTATVLNDPFMRMQVQASGAVITQASVGENIDITSGTSGVPNIAGISTCSVDAANIHTTGTLPFKISGIVQVPAVNALYDPTAANNWIEVTFNTNALLQTTGI